LEITYTVKQGIMTFIYEAHHPFKIVHDIN